MKSEDNINMNRRQICLVDGWVCIAGPGPAQSRGLTVTAMIMGRLKSRTLQCISLTKYYKFIVSSSHLFVGLPSELVNIGFHLYTLFTILSSPGFDVNGQNSLIKNWTRCIQDRNKWKLYVEKAKTFKE